MYNTIGLLSDKFGLEIIDSSSSMLADLGQLERAIKAEIHLIPRGVCWFQKFSRDALHEIHVLAAKYDGTICERDTYISGVLIAMSYDLAQHMDSFADNLIKNAIEKYRYLPFHVNGVLQLYINIS